MTGSAKERRDAVGSSWEQLDSALRRRAELTPALIDAVRRHAPHEKAPCDNVQATLERTLAAQDAPAATRWTSEEELQIALAGLERVGDAYGEVRSTPDYRAAQDALFFCRKEIREAAEAYNEAVTQHNAALSGGTGRFPWSRKAATEPAELFGPSES
jgi:LemA protein